MNSLSLMTIKIARLLPKSFPSASISAYYHTNSAVISLELFSIVCSQFVGSQGTQIKKKKHTKNKLRTVSITFQQKVGHCYLFLSPCQIPRSNLRMGFEHGLKLTYLFYMARPFDSMLSKGCPWAKVGSRTFQEHSFGGRPPSI